MSILRQTEQDEIDSVLSKEQPKQVSTNLLLMNNDSVPLEQLYHIVIDKMQNQSEVKIGSQPYRLTVKNMNLNKQWVILRNHDDFKWLFTALKIALPGYILPFFCSSSALQLLRTKMKYLNERENHIYLTSRLQELRNFIENVSSHPIFGFSQELRTFLIQNWEEHKKARRYIDIQVQEIQVPQPKSPGLFSKIKNLTWFDNNNPTAQTIKWSRQWLQIKYSFDNYADQLLTMTQKMFLFKHSKEQQMRWKGPNTQIDAFEQTKAKISSGQSFCDILIAELQFKILLPLVNQCKKGAQIRQQLNEKEKIEKIIHNLRKISEKDVRIPSLMRRCEKFESHFNQYWQIYLEEWRQTVQELDNEFSEAMDKYMKQMYKIWK